MSDKATDLDTPRGRAEFFISYVWPRISSADEPFRLAKHLALSLAHDVLVLTGPEGDRGSEGDR